MLTPKTSKIFTALFLAEFKGKKTEVAETGIIEHLKNTSPSWAFQSETPQRTPGCANLISTIDTPQPFETGIERGFRSGKRLSC